MTVMEQRIAHTTSRTGRIFLIVSAVMLAAFIAGMWHLGFSWSKFGLGLFRLGDFVVHMFPPDWESWDNFLRLLRVLGETVAIAFLGTIGASLLAIPLAFLAARNTTVASFVRFITRRFSDTLRGVDMLIWALIWVNVVGLGPFAGVLAIVSSDTGTFAKLYSEAMEDSDKRPVEGITAAGGSKLHAVRFGIFPQVLPLWISQSLYYFESNTRSATIIGIVGAGGIGMTLSEKIRQLEWQQVCAIIIMILVVVALIDFVSSRLRTTIIDRQPATT